MYSLISICAILTLDFSRFVWLLNHRYASVFLDCCLELMSVVFSSVTFLLISIQL